jgi:phosphoglycerol transferase MdoB-like AlkP superfamily enzyme
MAARVKYLIKTYLWTIAVFIVAKIVFMISCREGHAFNLGDVWDVIGHGLTLDLSTALYFLILPLLLVIISLWWTHRVLSRISMVYFIIIAIAFALAFVADTSLYPFWNYKLDASCLQYLETPSEATASVSTGYLLVRLAILVILAWLIWLGYPKLNFSLVPKGRRLLFTILYALFIPFLVIGIRGGLGESTTNVGQVYYSQNQFLNHSAVNPVFSFLASLEKTANYVPDYNFMEESERTRLMEGLYFTDSTEPDTLLKTQRPNIIVILLESCGGIFTEDIGKRSDIMPHLNQLTKEGVYFANFYANSYRTDRGTLCTWSGYPSFPRSSVMKMPAKTRLLPGIAQSLRREGYHTSYLYGGDINFTNMRSYLVTTGFEQLHWKNNYTSQEQKTSEWGVRDDITFATLGDMVRQQQSPFLIGYSTLSSHEPWDVPTHRLDDEVLNAFNYLDECIGNFISEMKKTPQWDNLLVIMLPDHGFSYLGVGEEHELHDHVPMLWLGGAIKTPRRIEQLCNQTDLPATLLGQLGITHDDYQFSRDVMSKSYRYPFAVHTYNNGITMKDSTGFAVFDLNANRIIVDKSSDSELLMKKGKAILQTAAKELKELN